MPVGLQVVGRPFGEEQVLALMHAIQDAHPMARPSLERIERWKA
jgi:Asp-tRNA(Asn)/Glu-tRNA(Gln) amidotransferase A subunit family amidase